MKWIESINHGSLLGPLEMALNEVRTISWISLGPVAFRTRGNVSRWPRGVEKTVDASFLENRPLNVERSILLYAGERSLS